MVEKFSLNSTFWGSFGVMLRLVSFILTNGLFRRNVSGTR